MNSFENNYLILMMRFVDKVFVSVIIKSWLEFSSGRILTSLAEKLSTAVQSDAAPTRHVLRPLTQTPYRACALLDRLVRSLNMFKT